MSACNIVVKGQKLLHCVLSVVKVLPFKEMFGLCWWGSESLRFTCINLKLIKFKLTALTIELARPTS